MLTLFRCPLITENKHLLRDPELSSVNRNCQIYIMPLDTLKIGIYKLKDFMNFFKVKRNSLLNSIYSSVFPDFRFKETPYVNFYTDPELSSSLYLKPKIHIVNIDQLQFCLHIVLSLCSKTIPHCQWCVRDETWHMYLYCMNMPTQFPCHVNQALQSYAPLTSSQKKLKPAFVSLSTLSTLYFVFRVSYCDSPLSVSACVNFFIQTTSLKPLITWCSEWAKRAVFLYLCSAPVSHFWVASTDATHIFVWNWGSKMAAFPVMVPDFFVL